MKSKIVLYGIIIVAFGLLAGISVVVYVFNKPKRDVAKTAAEYTLTASQLMAEFTQNEQAANAKYLSAESGKVISISGTISEITQAGDTILNILIKEPDMGPGSINCSIDKSEIPKAKLLKTGEKVTIKGECAGYLDIINEVSLVKCVLEK